MRDKYRRDERFFLDAADLLTRLKAESRVQVRERFVQKKHLRTFHQGARDGDTLLLAAGQLVRLPLQIIFDLDQFRGFHHLLVHHFLLEFRLAFQVLQREADVLPDRQMRIQSIVLEDHADAAVLRRKLRHVIFSEKDLAAGRHFQAADQIQRSGFAAAGGSEKADQLAVRDLEIEIVHRDDDLALLVAAREFLGQMLEYDLHRHAPSLSGS